MIKVIDSTFDSKVWNDRATHPMQSWEWGEARAKMGIEVVRIGEFENDELINVFQFTLHKVPYIPYKVGYLPRSTFPSQEVLEYLTMYGKKHNLINIKLEPNIIHDDSLVINNSKLVISPTPLFPQWTQIIDLTKSEDELLKNMKSKTRYNIRLAQKKGIVVKEMTTSEGFEIFYKLYNETANRQHYYSHNKSYHQTIFETLKESMSHILVAFFENKPLAAYHLMLFNDVLYYPYGASSIENKEVMAPNLLMWESIRFGKKHQAKHYDLWGSLAPDYDPDHMWAGFTRFKEGYNAEFTKMIGSFDLVTNTLLYTPFIWAQKLRERFVLS